MRGRGVGPYPAFLLPAGGRPPVGTALAVAIEVETITLTGGTAGLQARMRAQADALCALGPTLSEPELDTMVPSRLLSNDEVLVDEPVPLKELITGLAAVEIPAHTQQLLDLLPKSAPPEA